MKAGDSVFSIASKAVFLAALVGLISSLPKLATRGYAAEVRHQDDEHLKPSGKGSGDHDPSGATERHAQPFAAKSTNGILYHGGPVMLGTVNLYYIWYGTW